MDFNDFKYNKDNVPEQSAKRKIFFKELRERFYEEIKKSEAYKIYFEEFEKDSVESFILEYAERKAYLSEYYSYYKDIEHEQIKDIKYREKTEDLLRLIKQKKLFNMQLQWRAELIKIKGISLSVDFKFWEDYIDVCPFLPPITEQEIEVMKQFLESNNFDGAPHWICGWQDYDTLMERNETGDYENMPEWYEYYDGFMGTESLLHLPNIRGGKEEYYENIERKEYQRIWTNQKLGPVDISVPIPPAIFSGIEELHKFAKFFETDKHYVELFRLWEISCKSDAPKSSIENEEIENAIELLQEADYPVFMPAGYEWREAIILCARQYLNKILADELSVVYEENMMLYDLGITKGEPIEDVWNKYKEDYMVKMISDFTLKGRELCGEPSDFNF